MVDADDIDRRARLDAALAKADALLTRADHLAVMNEEREATVVSLPQESRHQVPAAPKLSKSRSSVKRDGAIIKAAMNGSAELIKRLDADRAAELKALKDRVEALEAEVAQSRKLKVVA